MFKHYKDLEWHVTPIVRLTAILNVTVIASAQVSNQRGSVNLVTLITT